MTRFHLYPLSLLFCILSACAHAERSSFTWPNFPVASFSYLLGAESSDNALLQTITAIGHDFPLGHAEESTETQHTLRSSLQYAADIGERRQQTLQRLGLVPQVQYVFDQIGEAGNDQRSGFPHMRTARFSVSAGLGLGLVYSEGLSREISEGSAEGEGTSDQQQETGSDAFDLSENSRSTILMGELSRRRRG